MLQHQSGEVRAEAIRILDEAHDEAVEPLVEKLLYDPELAVRTQALLYLAHHSRIDPLDRIETLGEFADFSIRAAMVSFLSQPGSHTNIDAARLLLDRMLDDDAPRTRYEAARLLELLPDQFEDQIRAVLTQGDTEQVRHAIHAVGKLRKRKLVGRVVDRLGDPALSADAVAALAQFGDRVVGTLRDHMVDPETPVAARRALPLVLQQIGTQATHAVLGESLLDPDVEVRYGVISALNKLQELHPTWRVDPTMLETLLDAEILGHLRSYQMIGALLPALADPAPVMAPLKVRHGAGTRADFPAVEAAVPAPGSAQRLRRRAVHQPDGSRQRAGVPGEHPVAAAAHATRAAARQRRADAASGWRWPTGC